MNFNDFQIQIPNGKTTGEIKTLCPKCSHTRKKKTDKCLSVNVSKGVWHCFNCGWDGCLPTVELEQKTFVKPVWKNKTELSNNVVKWFESRKINQETLNHWKITEGSEWMPQIGKETNTIQFNYFDENGDFTNVKFRDGSKNFKMYKDAKLIFYGLNHFRFDERAFLCEGELDALTLWQSSFKNVLSVPNGANVKNNNLEYFDRVAHLFVNTPEIYLCFDNDAPGRKLRDDIAERLGKQRCKIVEFKDCKDANDCLQKYGLQSIIESIADAKDFPLEGVFTISDMNDEIDDMYENGLESGVTIGHNKFDQHLSFVKGYITTITGIPGHGKSEFLDEIIIRLRLRNGWKTAFYSPENKPTKLHFSKISRKMIGKSWSGLNRMSKQDVEVCKAVMDQNIWFIKPETDFTLESILEHVKSLKLKHGIDAFVIDAWNKLEHKYGQSETKYIGESLDKIAHFCEHYHIHCFLVAHPTKIKKSPETGKSEIPTLYDIAGSANFANKTDNGVCVYRHFNDDGSSSTSVHVLKVKFSHWGQPGSIDFSYERDSGRYFEFGSPFNFDPWVSIKQQSLNENNEFLKQ